MIKTAKICVCAVCGAQWLPAKTTKNPGGDPERVERCSSCKSWKWNSDDPKAQLRKRRVPEITPHQQELARKRIAQSRQLKRAKDALDRESGKTPPPVENRAPRRMCRHRVYDCPICNPTAS